MDLQHLSLRKVLKNFQNIVCDALATEKNTSIPRVPVALILLNPALITQYCLQALTIHEKAMIQKLPQYGDVDIMSFTELKTFWTDMSAEEWKVQRPAFVQYINTEALKNKIAKVDQPQMKSYFDGSARHVTGINLTQQRTELLLGMSNCHASMQNRVSCAQVPALMEADLIEEVPESSDFDLRALQQKQPPVQLLPPEVTYSTNPIIPGLREQEESLTGMKQQLHNTLIKDIINANPAQRTALAQHVSKIPKYSA